MNADASKKSSPSISSHASELVVNNGADMFKNRDWRKDLQVFAILWLISLGVGIISLLLIPLINIPHLPLIIASYTSVLPDIIFGIIKVSSNIVAGAFIYYLLLFVTTFAKFPVKNSILIFASTFLLVDVIIVINRFVFDVPDCRNAVMFLDSDIALSKFRSEADAERPFYTLTAAEIPALAGKTIGYVEAVNLGMTSARNGLSCRAFLYENTLQKSLIGDVFYNVARDENREWVTYDVKFHAKE